MTGDAMTMATRGAASARAAGVAGVRPGGAADVTPEPRTAPMLRLDGLEKRYSRKSAAAVSSVDLSVAEGEVLGLVGESGCGKSTLLRLVAGLEVPDAGTVSIAGRAVAGPGAWVPPERRGVGLVFQDFALFPHLRSVDNVAYGLTSLPRRERRARAEEVLDLVGLPGLGSRFPHELSGGQQQRVALARALAPEPRLLLLDEPFSNLDSALKRLLREELAEILRRTGITAILVVHDAEDVMALADRVAVMRAGSVRQTETPDFLYSQPRDEYVARFFGETNILHARPRGDGFETSVGFIPCTLAAGRSDPVRLCLRPEHFHLSTDLDGDAASCASGCGVGAGCAVGGRPAVVRQIRQSGLQRRIILGLENGVPGGASLTVDVGPEPRLAQGDRVYVQPKPGCLHVLQGEVAEE
jgi:iron(III) transport system ATP-binding protein